ncbi:cyclase family protein [Sporomusa sp. KB1]|jgi:kynurenine formamidase|uniref:cyclase family protein n=1 Tax=Sporomusa sp. KB1 TaxID=943346 RepID=UPI0011A1547B|nr:cyclase family protein [Sporomusa sp. KB1]TWH51977.1 kynurenine formamidase [Sporomusa sp. KB1]
MSKYVELGYPIFEGMPVHPVVPQPQLTPKEQIERGDYWNGTIFTIYTHAGTHVDAPWHYCSEGVGIDKIPIENFVYKKPLVINAKCEPNHLISIDELKAAGEALYEADMLLFNTGYYKYRERDFQTYSTDFPTCSPEAAEFIRKELPKVKAVAIDSLSIENIPNGIKDGFKTHNAFLNPVTFPQPTILVYEDYNPEPIIGKKIISAFATPLRLKDRDGTVINIVAEIE